MKHGDKAMTRLRLRQESFDKLKPEQRAGRKRPGSMKSCQPLTKFDDYGSKNRARECDTGSAKERERKVFKRHVQQSTESRP